MLIRATKPKLLFYSHLMPASARYQYMVSIVASILLNQPVEVNQ
jgi:hypothetical protein